MVKQSKKSKKRIFKKLTSGSYIAIKFLKDRNVTFISYNVFVESILGLNLEIGIWKWAMGRIRLPSNWGSKLVIRMTVS